jgi:hypothetical protein
VSLYGCLKVARRTKARGALLWTYGYTRAASPSTRRRRRCAVVGRGRFGRVLSPGGGLRSRRLPLSKSLSSRPRTLFSSGRNSLSEDAVRKLV